MKDNALLFEGLRRALLVFLDYLEQYIGVSPTTAEIRKSFKGR
jgi:hypothetical protein